MDENPNCVLYFEFRAVVRWPPYWPTRPIADKVLGKLADRAFSRQGKNKKFKRQFNHNW